MIQQAFVWGLGREGDGRERRGGEQDRKAFKARAQRHVKLLNDTKLWASLDLGGRKNKFSLIMAPRGQTNYGNRHMQEFFFFFPQDMQKQKSWKQGKMSR